MTKQDLATKIAKKTNLTTKEAIAVLNVFIDATTDALQRGEDITLRGLCTLKVNIRKGKSARDIFNNKEVWVPEHKVVKFVPSKYLSYIINK